MTVTRRSLLTGTGVAVLGGLAGFAVARNSAAATAPSGTTAANAYGVTPPSSTASGSGRTPLVAVAELPDGGGVVSPTAPIVVTRTGSAVHAFSAICTHQGCEVNRVAGGQIFCPCHGSVFDAATGKVVGGPAPRPLPRVAVSVRGGEVYRA